MTQLPVSFCERLFAGEHPVKVWREFHGMPLSVLSQITGLTERYLKLVEKGYRHLSEASLHKIAEALDTHPLNLKAPNFGECSLASEADEDEILRRDV